MKKIIGLGDINDVFLNIIFLTNKFPEKNFVYYHVGLSEQISMNFIREFLSLQKISFVFSDMDIDEFVSAGSFDCYVSPNGDIINGLQNIYSKCDSYKNNIIKDSNSENVVSIIMKNSGLGFFILHNKFIKGELLHKEVEKIITSNCLYINDGGHINFKKGRDITNFSISDKLDLLEKCNFFIGHESWFSYYISLLGKKQFIFKHDLKNKYFIDNINFIEKYEECYNRIFK